MGTVGLTFYFFPDLWMRIFSNDPEVIRYGIILCRITAFIQIPLSLTMILAGSLRGAGETTWVMFSTIIGGWLIRLPFAYILGVHMNMGIVFIWIAMPLDWIVRAAVLYVKYSREKWDTSIRKII